MSNDSQTKKSKILWSDEAEIEMCGHSHAERYGAIQSENLFQGAQDLTLGWRFTFQQDNEPKHSAKKTQERLWESSERPGMARIESGPEPNRASLERCETGCASSFPIQPGRVWSSLPRRMGEASKKWRVELVASFPRRLEAVIAAKGALTKYLVKGLNTWK